VNITGEKEKVEPLTGSPMMLPKKAMLLTPTLKVTVFWNTKVFSSCVP